MKKKCQRLKSLHLASDKNKISIKYSLCRATPSTLTRMASREGASDPAIRSCTQVLVVDALLAPIKKPWDGATATTSKRRVLLMDVFIIVDTVVFYCLQFLQDSLTPESTASASVSTSAIVATIEFVARNLKQHVRVRVPMRLSRSSKL